MGAAHGGCTPWHPDKPSPCSGRLHASQGQPIYQGGGAERRGTGPRRRGRAAAYGQVWGARLVDGHAVLVVHLVELVDEADAAVGQHERAALQRPLARHRVLLHRGRQADRARALACAAARRAALGRNQGAPCPNPACCARPAPARWRSGSPLEAPPACRRAAAGKARVAPSASPRALCWNAGDAVSRALHVLPACRPGQTEPNRAQRCTRRRATSLRARRTCAKILTYHTLHRAQRRRFYMTPRARCTGGLHGALGHLLHVIEELALGDALP